MLLIAWTTVAHQTDADRIAHAAVESCMAACVQIDGPITSVYRWSGRTEEAKELRLTFKCLPSHLAALEQLVTNLHPYETPEWIVIPATQVSEKYLSWARTPTHYPTL